jgi:hypothetical protein
MKIIHERNVPVVVNIPIVPSQLEHGVIRLISPQMGMRIKDPIGQERGQFSLVKLAVVRLGKQWNLEPGGMGAVKVLDYKS